MPTEMTQRQRMWSAFMRNRTALVGGVLALLVVLVAIFAPFISPFDPLEQDSYFRLMGGSSKHWLGTDDFGRDVLSRIIWGSRVSLLIGAISVALGMLAGTAMGMVAGYFRGKLESLIMRSVDILMCFPDLILAIGVTAALGSNLFNLIVKRGIDMTLRFARLAHESILLLRES